MSGIKQHSVSFPVCRDVQKQKALVKNESLLNILSGEALRKSSSYFINSLVPSNSVLFAFFGTSAKHSETHESYLIL